MRYRGGELAILSAESYDDGRIKRTPAGGRKSKQQVTDFVVAEPEEGPVRKRRKASSEDGPGEEEDGRRTRGRPRLEPTDETAQDVSCASAFAGLGRHNASLPVMRYVHLYQATRLCLVTDTSSATRVSAISVMDMVLTLRTAP